jgi:signal transduction histidine kinase
MIDSCLIYIDKSDEIIKKNKTTVQAVENNLFKSLIYIKLNEINKAKNSIQLAEINIDNKENDELHLKIMNKKAYFYFFLDSINKAISLEHNVLKKINKLKQEYPLIKIIAYKNLASFYLNINDYRTAYYFNELYKSYAITISYPYKLFYYALKTNYYFTTGDLNAAIDYVTKQIKEADKINNINTKLTALGNKATLLLYKGELEESKRLLESISRIEEKNGFLLHLAQTYENLSRVYYYLEKDVKAKDIFSKAISLIKDKPYKHSHLAVWYENKSNDYEINGDNKNALVYYKLMKAESDSLYQKSFYSKIAESETKYQTQQKEAEILKLSNENLKKEAALIKSNNVIYAVSGILFATLILILFFWHKRKQKERLIKLETAIKATDEEKKRIGKELHDGIAGSIIRLVHEVENKDVNLSDKLLKTYNEVRDLSHQLNNTPMHGEAFMERLIEIIPDNHENQVFSFKITPSNLELIEPYGTHIYRIIQELITNNLKHAKATKTIILIKYDKEKLTINYSDNGIGTKELKKGTGIINIEDRVAIMKGKILINNSNGFSVDIEIPYIN